MLFLVFACEKEVEFSSTPQNENQSQNLAGRFADNPILADYRNGRLVFENQEASRMVYKAIN